MERVTEPASLHKLPSLLLLSFFFVLKELSQEGCLVRSPQADLC